MYFNNGHALVIGVGSYQYTPKANIPISVRDAKALRDVLYNPELCGYPQEQVTLLHDKTASRKGILDALDALSATGQDATVLIFYCGHGDYGTDGNYYLTTYDTKASHGKVLKGTGIQEAELLDKLRTIPAKRLLLLFNACHAGEISPHLAFAETDGAFGSISLPTNATDALLSTGEGRIIITASRPEQKSWIGRGELSLFTQAVVDSLRGQGYVVNNNGYISAFALYESIYYAIQEAVEEIDHTQEPELTVLKGVGPFPVSLYRGATSLGSFAPEASIPTGMAARETSPARSARHFQQYIINVNASGDRAIAIGGSVSGSTIVTGGYTGGGT